MPVILKCCKLSQSWGFVNELRRLGVTVQGRQMIKGRSTPAICWSNKLKAATGWKQHIESNKLKQQAIRCHCVRLVAFNMLLRQILVRMGPYSQTYWFNLLWICCCNYTKDLSAAPTALPIHPYSPPLSAFPHILHLLSLPYLSYFPFPIPKLLIPIIASAPAHYSLSC